MKQASSIAVLILFTGCGEKPADGGRLGSSAPQPGARSAPSGKGVAATLDETVEYLDGGTPRPLWISKDLVAEFQPSDVGRGWVLAADPGAQEVPQPQPIVRIWRLSGAQRGEAFARAVWRPALHVSPVLHEGPSEAFPMCALPGGVVATFKPDWDKARIEDWLHARSLTAEAEPVVADANMFLVSTMPGLSALLVASELRKTGELVDVAPNFWRQHSAK